MTTNETTPVQPAVAVAPGIEQLVTEEQIAQMTGLEVSQVRLMISGNAPIPPHLEGIIPKPVTQISGYVWRPEDVADLPSRIAAAQQLLEERAAEELAAREAAREAAATASEPVDLTLDVQPREDIHAAQRERQAQRERDAETFRLERDEYLEATMPVGKSKKRGAWWKSIASSWGESRGVKGRTKVGSRDDSSIREAAHEAAVAAGSTATEPIAAEPITEFEQLLRTPPAEPVTAPTPTYGADGLPIATSASSTRRFAREEGRDALASQKAQDKAERAQRQLERAQEIRDAKERKRAQAAARKAAAEAEQAQRKEQAGTTAEQRAAAKQARREESARLKIEARAAKAEAKGAARDANESNASAKKAEAANSRVAKIEAAEEKKQQALASKEAKVARQRKYKEALERWREDVKVAKDGGQRPPKKPKAPKNDTSKPKPIDVTNAIRAFATMLENSPGELDSVQVMVREYEGTQLGEAFRRIEYRISDQNATLVEAFAPEKIFPVEVHNMLAVGAKTIAPGPALRTAVKLMDAASDSKRKLRSEIMEPASVGALSLVALFATAYGVMPTFVTMYESLEMPIPPVSNAILVMSDIVVWVLGGAGVLALGYLIWWFAYGRTWDKWRTALDAYSLHMPLMGKANQAQETYQLLKVLHAYLAVGSPEREAIVDAAAATKNRAIKKHLLTTAELMVAGRVTFAAVFDSDMFPNMARNIVGIGEKAGRVTESIAQLETVYEREAEVETQQAIARVSGTVAGVSSMIFTVVVTMVTVPPLEMFGSTLSYGQ